MQRCPLAARQLMADYGVPENTDAAGYNDALFQLVITHGVMPTVWNPAFAAEPGARPVAHALARLQAGTPGWVVSGRAMWRSTWIRQAGFCWIAGWPSKRSTNCGRHARRPGRSRSDCHRKPSPN